MLFLVEVEVEQMPAIPLNDFLDLVVQEWELVQRLKRTGKVQAAGKLAGRRGAVAIFNVESLGEVDDFITRLPLFQYFTKIMVAPLSSPEEAAVQARRLKMMANNRG